MKSSLLCKNTLVVIRNLGFGKHGERLNPYVHVCFCMSVCATRGKDHKDYNVSCWGKTERGV